MSKRLLVLIVLILVLSFFGWAAMKSWLEKQSLPSVQVEQARRPLTRLSVYMSIAS